MLVSASTPLLVGAGYPIRLLCSEPGAGDRADWVFLSQTCIFVRSNSESLQDSCRIQDQLFPSWH